MLYEFQRFGQVVVKIRVV